MIMYKIILFILVSCGLFGAWYVTGELYRAEAQDAPSVSFTIEPGESVGVLAERLESEQVIRSSFWFTQYLKWKELDRAVRAGSFTIEAPITLARVAEVLLSPSQDEREITILPGWTLRDIATYFEAEGIATAAEVYALTGESANSDTTATLTAPSGVKLLSEKPTNLSLEGYLAPDTYRIFANSTIESVLQKLLEQRNAQFTDTLRADIAKSGRTIHEVLTIASLLEKEVRGAADKKIAADIFWKRYDAGWAMQADSSIHYIHGTNGSVFTTREMRESLNPYNTYKYPGLPPGPIGTPSLMAIDAAVYPTPNDYWYFITTLDTGEAKFGRTLDEHNANVQRYLR